MVGREAPGHQAAHGVAHDVGALDAQLAEERGHLGGHLVEDEPRVRMAGAESRQVDGRDPERAGERGQVALPPGARAGEAMEQDERRTTRAGLRGHDRAVSGPAHGAASRSTIAHAILRRASGRRAPGRGAVGSSTIGSSAIQLRTTFASCSGCE